MNVRVRMFAGARQAAGRDTMDLQMPEDTTVGQLRRRLATEIPQMSGLVERAMFAVDAEYAADGQKIPPDADVAMIPPVSGG